MPEVIYLALASLLSVLGMAWLALAMDVHWAQARCIDLVDSKPPSRLLRAIACLALLMSLIACLLADRPSIAVLVWVMLMTAAAVLIAWGLSKSPQVLKICWPF